MDSKSKQVSKVRMKKNTFKNLKSNVLALHDDINVELDTVGDIQVKWNDRKKLEWNDVYKLLYSLCMAQAEISLLSTYLFASIELTEKLAKKLKVEIQVPVNFQKEINEFVAERERAKKAQRQYLG